MCFLLGERSRLFPVNSAKHHETTLPLCDNLSATPINTLYLITTFREMRSEMSKEE